MLMFMLALTTGWLWVVILQQNGNFLCSTILVQFGDDTSVHAGTFSGLYDLKPWSGGIRAQRVEYIERQSGGKAKFAYCSDIGAWTFSWTEDWTRDDSDSGALDFDPCEWKARSSETATFDLLRTALSPWFVKNENGGEIKLDPFFMSCNDCGDPDTDCSGRGVCLDAECTCDDGWFGVGCEFRSPCTRIGKDQRAPDFPALRGWSRELDILKDDNLELVEVYHRPVYVQEAKPGEFDIIFFTGRRWAATASEFLWDYATYQVEEKSAERRLANYFRNEFHAHWSKFRVEYLTEPVDFGTPINSESPVDLRWTYADTKMNNNTLGMQRSTGTPVMTIFWCTFCDSRANPCLHDGKCGGEGRCQCSPGVVGSLCEDQPTNNGNCDAYFNTAGFAFDGGDCCGSVSRISYIASGHAALVQSKFLVTSAGSDVLTTLFLLLCTCRKTCNSTANFLCGMEDNGYVSSGYSQCHLPTNQWYQVGDAISGSAWSRSGTDVALSYSGNVLVVEGQYAPNAAGLRIYDRDGSRWILRSALQPPSNISVSSFDQVDVLEEIGFVRNPLKSPPVKIFVISWYAEVEEYSLDVYLCERDCSPTPISTFKDTWRVFVSPSGSLGLRRSTRIEIFDIGDFRDTNYTLRAVLGDEMSEIWVSEDHNAYTEVKYIHDWSTSSIVAGSNITVKSFAFDGKYYNQLGSDFVVGVVHATDVIPHPAISNDGKMVALPACGTASPSSVHIFEFDEGTWTQGEAPFIDNAICEQAESIEISMRNKVLAVSTGVQVHTFFHSEYGWEPLGQPFNTSVFSMSGDGHTLAIGDTDDATDFNNAGIIRVYSRSEHDECPASATRMRFSYTTTDRLDWILTDADTDKVVREGSSGNYSLTAVVEECLEDIAQRCYSLYIFPYGGNQGIGPAPSAYGVFLNGERIQLEPFIAGGVKKIRMGNCTATINTTYGCVNGTSLLQVEAVLRGNPDNMSWSLVDDGNDKVVLNRGPTRRAEALVVGQEACLDVTQGCFYFSVENGYPSGFLNPNPDVIGLYVDGEPQTYGGSTTRDHGQGRVYIGDNECCPEGSTRLQVRVRSCEGALWMLATLNGTKIEAGSLFDKSDSVDCDPSNDNDNVHARDKWHYPCVEDPCLTLSFYWDYSDVSVAVFGGQYDDQGSFTEFQVYGVQPSKNLLLGACPLGASPFEPISLIEGVPLRNQSSVYNYQQYRLDGLNPGDIVKCVVEGDNLNVSLTTGYGEVTNEGFGGTYGYCSPRNETDGMPYFKESCLPWPPARSQDTFLSVVVEALEPYAGLTITCSIWIPHEPIYLSDGQPLTDQASEEGIQEYLLESIPAGSTVVCNLDGGTEDGDADLYASYDRDISHITDFGCQSAEVGSVESCEAEAAPSDNSILHVFVEVWSPYTNITITCSILNK